MAQSVKTLRIAHRGDHLHHIENTLEAFAAAYTQGCDGVEFDVQLSADGIPVIFHDDDLSRLAGRKEVLNEMTWAEICTVTLRNPGGMGQAYFIPSLDQFLTAFGDRPYYLELKVPKGRQEDQNWLKALGNQCLERVQGSSPHTDTFLASFHLPLVKHLVEQNAFKNLGAICEDASTLANLLEGFSVKGGESWASRLRWFSLSWSLYLGFQAANRILPPPEQLMVWDIHGVTALSLAVTQKLGGIVADEIDLVVKA